MSDSIIGRIDEMATRINELESSITELMNSANSGVQPQDSRQELQPQERPSQQ